MRENQQTFAIVRGGLRLRAQVTDGGVGVGDRCRLGREMVFMLDPLSWNQPPHPRGEAQGGSGALTGFVFFLFRRRAVCNPGEAWDTPCHSC